MMEKEIQVGDRIQDFDGNRATVKFIGQVPSTSGIWLGVDWDDETRGKHDGSRDGIRYFETRTRISGSFIRISKVTTGIGVREAIEERYGAGENNVIDVNVMKETQKTMRASIFEVVGFDKIKATQSDFSKLKVIYVRQMGVTYDANRDSNLSEFIPEVEYLDLAENLFGSWDQIIEITGRLSKLKTLSLSENRLLLPSLPISFPRLQHLIMGRMNYRWNDVKRIVNEIPTLRILQIHCNEISEIDGDSDDEPLKLDNLEELDLNLNPIRDWNRVVNRLSKLSKLRILKLNDCGLTEIGMLTENDFKALTVLELNNNEIDWMSLGRLDVLRNLTEIKIRGRDIPVDSMSSRSLSHRQAVIAMLSKLKILNSTVIDRQERYGAELDYLKRFGIEYLESNCNNNRPRYEALVQIYGPPERGELSTKPPLSLADMFLTVTITCPDHEFRDVEKKIPCTMKVRSLKALLKKTIKAPTLNLDVSYKSRDVVVPFDDDMREVGYYGIENNDVIIVRW